MGVLDDIRGYIIGLDTAPLVYFIEKHPTFHPLVRPFFSALDMGQFQAVTSTITLVETLVHPLRNNHAELAGRYRDILLHSANVTTHDVSPAIAEQAAELRATYNLRTPDAVQLATALYAGATFFLTNDRALKKLPLLRVLTLDDLQM